MSPTTPDSSTTDARPGVPTLDESDITVAESAVEPPSTRHGPIAAVRRFVHTDAALWLLVPSALMFVVWVGRALPIGNGDSSALVQSSRALVTCVEQDQWNGCAGAAQYGVLQHLPAGFLTWKGLDDYSALVGLGLMSLAAFVGVLVIAARFPSCGPRRRLLLVATVVLGPLIAYAGSTMGEMLTTFVFVALAAALVARRPVFVFVLALLAAGTREPAIASLLPFAIAALVGTPSADRARTVRVAIAACAGLLAGTASVLLLNEWRYDTWKNLIHSDPALQVPGLSLRANLAAGVWVAPGGGVAVYWLLGAAVALVLPLTALVLRRHDWRAWFGPGLLVVGLGFQTAGLASWYAPYGWVSWGPRLMIPVVAMAACLAVVVCDDAVRWWWAIARRFWVLGVAFAALCTVSALASYGYVNSPGTLSNFFVLDAECPTGAVIQTERGYYFHCLLYGSWWKWPTMWWYGVREIWQSFEGLVIAGGLVLFAVGVLLRLDASAREEPEPAVPASL